jgi:hypothetical protein
MRALIAAAVLAACLTTGASAQVQRQDATVSSGVVVVPPPPADAPSGVAAPNTVPFASATVRSVTVQPVCETQRREFSDESGWRVRDVRVCY